MDVNVLAEDYAISQEFSTWKERDNLQKAFYNGFMCCLDFFKQHCNDTCYSFLFEVFGDQEREN